MPNHFDPSKILYVLYSLMALTFVLSIILYSNILQLDWTFNEAKWGELDHGIILTTIITTSSAIVAIGFSINHITLTKIFETYSSKQIGLFFKKQNIFKSFIVLIMLIVISTIFLVIDTKIGVWSFVCTISSVIWFIYGLGLFFESFYRMFRLTNKFDIMDDLTDDIIARIMNLK